jgi:hypothetical protein
MPSDLRGPQIGVDIAANGLKMVYCDYERSPRFGRALATIGCTSCGRGSL